MRQGFSPSILTLVSVCHEIFYQLISRLILAEFDNPEALSKYYKLLASVLRVIASVVLSRGPQNQQTIEQARLFMRENRASMVGIFKRQARIGATMTGDATRVVDELVELFVLLISMTDFLEVSGLHLPWSSFSCSNV